MSEDRQKIIFTKNLNSYIEISGKTQLEIAKSIGVSPQTFNTWCKGIAIPRMGKVQALADYFHINKSDLIEEKKDNGHKFVEPDTFSLDEFMKQHDATELEMEIVKTYFELDPKIRTAAMEHFKRRLTSAVAENPALIIPDSAEELETQYPPVNIGNSSESDAE